MAGEEKAPPERGCSEVVVGVSVRRHPKGKPPSKHTIAVIEKARAELPFADNQDLAEQKKGFIAAPESRQIMADAGRDS